eukprot:5429342-Amphidinium_carterae.1
MGTTPWFANAAVTEMRAIITYETFWRKQQIKADCSRNGRSRVCYLTMLEYRLRQHSFIDRPTSMCLADITINAP